MMKRNTQRRLKSLPKRKPYTLYTIHRCMNEQNEHKIQHVMSLAMSHSLYLVYRH